ncbi:S-adenosyl-L-methionine-dependent methyltransferase [Gonapodya prolifera JEL478]|uniref:S-adenosyl-L-methionine-dependent methyltransferase n=1 Tax=Gonapodya prolifera (strain JEL478) TaxID=1344416 RepID=A0A139A9T4_GONPJ|nr:S-adenosyl-L-methionine-dependent methyltransferase [Gonapodya prolifera JEL478]|eukprot:KXS13414.1 S-adenosyl-L-methionine-dependent methyltransferase [Gonapodya prolifera JEL478]
MSRPEHTAPPEIFYNESEATKYTQNSRIMQIQADMTTRALELLSLPPDEPCYLLDIGCGSGLSGEVLEVEGHVWVGLDISEAMLDVANEREVEGDLFLHDIGHGLGFRPGTFDGCISVSVLQWLCNADRSSHVPKRRLARFFTTLYSSLTRGGRAVFQFYPENPDQVELIVSSAMVAGFTGGLVVDYPNSTRAKKYFLVLFAGSPDNSSQPLPQALGTDLPQGTEPSQIVNASAGRRPRPEKRGKGQKRKSVKDRDYIMRKKELNKRRGKDVPLDSKYTGRKRSGRF